MDSRTILQTFADSLEAAIADSTVLFELYKELSEDLEPRQDIDRARIGVYMMPETNIVKVGAEKPADSRQQIGIDISVVRGYRGDGGSKGELPALDLKDKVIEWVKAVDAHSTTNGALHSLGYEGSTDFNRRKRYVTMTLMLSGFRDLHKAQV